MNRLSIYVLVLSLLGLSGAAADEPVVYTTYLLPHDYEQFSLIMAEQGGREPWEIEDLGSVATTRNQVEPLLLAAAVVLGGCECRIEYQPYLQHTPHARTIIQVQSGVEITHGVAGFTDDRRYAEGVYLSDPILAADQFYVGFYTHQDRQDILSLTDTEALRALRYAVVRSWELDNLVLEENGLRKALGESWDNLIRMIETGRADVFLQPFINTPDMSFEANDAGDRFHPIPGVKMHFGQARHYIVSQAHPDGERLLEAINRGLAILREDGTLYRAMVHAGVINENAQDFRVVEF